MMLRRHPSESWRLPWRGVLAAVLVSAALALPPVHADEIRFRTGAGPLTGTVLEENGGTVTIRFPREAIESISRETGTREDVSKQAQPSGLEERVRELEKKMESLPAVASTPPARQNTGEVEGVIRWRDRPLSNARVMIVPVTYAGRPSSSGGPGHRGIAGGAPAGGKNVAHETETDAAGRYRFERIPPGEYLLYWMPNGETGWVRRLRDTADLEVIEGGATVLNIPAEGK